jgi:tetratricopeptide (TPR) repeat protein
VASSAPEAGFGRRRRCARRGSALAIATVSIALSCVASPATAARRWDDALEALGRARDPSSADWHNLMGFASRKRDRPDLEAAQRHCDEALRIDPDRRGALEYAGELALAKGDLRLAARHLERLVRLCPAGCEERDDLEREVGRFRRDGGGARR